MLLGCLTLHHGGRINRWVSDAKLSFEMGPMKAVTLARKPLEGSICGNVLDFSCGAIQIQESRIFTSDPTILVRRTSPFVGPSLFQRRYSLQRKDKRKVSDAGDYKQPSGRWPANVILIHEDQCRRDGTRKVSGTPKSYVRNTTAMTIQNANAYGKGVGQVGGTLSKNYADEDGLETVESWSCGENCPVKEMDQKSGLSGGASRFFVQSGRASK